MSSLSNTVRPFRALSFAALALGGFLCHASAADAPAKARAAEKEQTPADTKATAVAPSAAGTNVLIIRNVRSWKRKTDFEEALKELDQKFDVKLSAEIGITDLSRYRTVIIPGAQWKDDYYNQYMDNVALFDRYVTNGGTLLLELNGAENFNITLPRGVTMVRHGSKDNAILLPKHPILDPLNGQPIHANYASHGYLEGAPKDALILATEEEAEQPVLNKPTFIEYKHGTGRVIAACQCFHDQDGSGRGILMETAISYAADRQWYVSKK